MEVLKGLPLRRSAKTAVVSLRWAALVFLVSALELLLPAADLTPSEYEVKAAFLYNFIKFVEWPAHKLETNAPFVIAIAGDDPFNGGLERNVSGKRVNGRAIQVIRLRSERQVPNCHVLFVPNTESRRLPALLQAAKGQSVLTVGESERFCDLGGIISFLMEANKVRFEINLGAAEAEGLKISSKLLSVASRVRRQNTGTSRQ